MARLVPANTAVATERRVFFHLVQPDGITPATSEAGGQPQVSVDGGGWSNTGIGTLNAIGFGRYYADVTQALIIAPCNVETRYASGGTAEVPGDSLQVVAVNVYDSSKFGLTVWPANFANLAIDEGTGGTVLAADGLNNIPVTDPGPVSGMTTIPAMIVASWRMHYRMVTLTSTQIQTFKDDQTTVNTTRPVSDNGIIQVMADAV